MERDVAWARLDDGYPTHPKLIDAGAEAGMLDVAGICYASKHLTDGFISDNVLPGLYPPLKQPRRVAQILVKVGRWERDDERKGYWIHDYLQYHFTAEKAAQKRATDHERATRAAEARWANGRILSRDGDARMDARAHASEHADKHVKPDASSRPVPSQVNLPLTPAPVGAGESGQRKNSRAHGTSPRQLNARAAMQQSARDRLAQAERLGLKYATAGKSLDQLPDLVKDKGLTPEEMDAVLKGFNRGVSNAPWLTEHGVP